MYLLYRKLLSPPGKFFSLLQIDFSHFVYSKSKNCDIMKTQKFTDVSGKYLPNKYMLKKEG